MAQDWGEVTIRDFPGDVHDDFLECYLLLNSAKHCFLLCTGEQLAPSAGMLSRNDLTKLMADSLDEPLRRAFLEYADALFTSFSMRRHPPLPMPIPADVFPVSQAENLARHLLENGDCTLVWQRLRRKMHVLPVYLAQPRSPKLLQLPPALATTSVGAMPLAGSLPLLWISLFVAWQGLPGASSPTGEDSDDTDLPAMPQAPPEALSETEHMVTGLPDVDHQKGRPPKVTNLFYHKIETVNLTNLDHSEACILAVLMPKHLLANYTAQMPEDQKQYKIRVSYPYHISCLNNNFSDIVQ
eukprot:s1923_g14.t1